MTAPSFTADDAAAVFTITAQDIDVCNTVVCRCAREGYTAFVIQNCRYASIGSIMATLTSYRQCVIVDAILPLWPDITQKELYDAWPSYRTFVMERFAILRSEYMCADTARIVNEYLL